MKYIFKLVIALLIGFLIGIGGSTICIGLFSDMTIAQFVEKLKNIEVLELIGVMLFSILSAFLGGFLHIIIHEAGHLVTGLLSGYKFVSFRIFNYTILKTKGKLKIKKFGIAGTGGQCLMTPPDCPIEELKFVWYNLGGVLFNLLFSAVAIVLWWNIVENEFMSIFLMLFALLGGLFALMNGIPLKLFVSNDGMNTIRLHSNIEARRIFANSLRVNAMIQDGMRPKEMPEECFWHPDEIDFKDYFAIQQYNFVAGLYLDKEQYDEAYQMYSEMVAHKGELLELFYIEAVCEFVYLSLLRGDKDKAVELLDDKVKTYIEQYGKVMSSKLRVQCAMALMIDDDKAKAVEIYRELYNKRNAYLMQGEVLMDLALIESMFKQKGVEYEK